MTESMVKKSDLPLSAARTVLSVQMRPTFWVDTFVSLPPSAAQWRQRSRVSGSTLVVAGGPSLVPAFEPAFASGIAARAIAGSASMSMIATVTILFVNLLI